MKKKTVQELVHAPKEELVVKLKELRDRLRTLIFEVETGKEKNVHAIRDLRKEIARVQTLIHQK